MQRQNATPVNAAQQVTPGASPTGSHSLAGAQVPLGRTFFGGLLMGLANLVPGISGGTMILAVGLYERFIESLANVTRLRLRPSSVFFMAVLLSGAVCAVLAFSGIAVALVRDQRWIMYSLFVGMTLGGVPLLFRLCFPLERSALIAFLSGFGLMLAQWLELFSARLPDAAPYLVLGGVLGATSMVLPGISGAYVLLILGLYELVIGSLSVSALKADPAECARVLVPVLIGAGLGVAVLSNVLKLLLARFSAPVHAALLGLLIGSVLNLNPFQEALHPDLAHKPDRKAVAMLVEGESLDEVRAKYGEQWDADRAEKVLAAYGDKSVADLKRMGDDTRPYSPRFGRISLAFLLGVGGFALTRLVSRSKPASPAGQPAGGSGAGA